MARPGETNQGQRGTSGTGPDLGPIKLSQPLMLRGGAGGLTAVGKVGQQTLPAQGAAQREGEEARAGGMNEAANRGYQNAAAMSMAQDREDEYQRRAEEERAIQNQARDKYYQQIAADAEQTKAEKVDPNRIFTGENGSTNRMLAIIGGALGGYVQARTGRNPFMDSMNATIERDIAAQKSEIESARDSRKAKQSALWGDVEKYGSNEAALMKRRADMWDAVAQQARGFETLAKSDLMKGDAQAMAADAEGHAQEWRLKTAEWMAAHTRTRGGARLNPMALAEFVAKGGNEKAAMERFETARRFGMSAAEAGVVALQGPNMSSDMRNEAFKAGLANPRDAKLSAEESHRLATGLMSAGIPEAEGQLARLKAMQAKADPGSMPSGLGLGNRVLSKIPGGKLVQGDEASINKGEIKGAISAYRKAMTGVAYSPAELEEATDRFLGENVSRAAFDAAIARMEQDLAMKKGTVMAGASPEAASRFTEQRKQNIGQGAGVGGGASSVAFKPAGR